MHTRGRQMTTMRTVLDNALVAHDFEVSRQDYQPNVLIMSAGNLTSNGCKIVLDDEGSYIEDKTSGEISWMHEVNGMYMLKLWVSKKTSKEAGF